MYRPLKAVKSMIHVNTWCFTLYMLRLSKIFLEPQRQLQLPTLNFSKVSDASALLSLLPNNFVSGAQPAKRRTPSGDPRISDRVRGFFLSMLNSFALFGRAVGKENGWRRARLCLHLHSISASSCPNLSWHPRNGHDLILQL